MNALNTLSLYLTLLPTYLQYLFLRSLSCFFLLFSDLFIVIFLTFFIPLHFSSSFLLLPHPFPSILVFLSLLALTFPFSISLYFFYTFFLYLT